MRILLDTNLLIGREDPNVLSPTLGRLLQLLNENAVTALIHPASLTEVTETGIPSAEVSFYPRSVRIRFWTPLRLDIRVPPAIREHVGSRPSGRAIGIRGLRDAGSFLITEDQGLIHRSNRVGLRRGFCLPMRP